jgi:hypothetical protein
MLSMLRLLKNRNGSRRIKVWPAGLFRSIFIEHLMNEDVQCPHDKL